VQDGWAKLLEEGVPVIEKPEENSEAQQAADREANIVGQTAGHAVVHEARKYVAIPETRENEDGTMATIAPWDIVDPSDGYRRNLDPLLETILGLNGPTPRTPQRAEALKRTEEVLHEFSEYSPEDFGFLMNYIAGRRKGCFTRNERNRAGAIVAKLRRRIKKAAKAADKKPVEK
jgi:hypothetical protein